MQTNMVNYCVDNGGEDRQLERQTDIQAYRQADKQIIEGEVGWPQY